MNLKLSFFDLDRTLLKVNISFAFGKFLYQKGELSFLIMIYCCFQYFRHKFFGLNLFFLQEKIFQIYFFGKSIDRISSLAEEFLEKHFSDFLYIPAVTALQKAIQNRHIVTILSSSPDFLVKLVAKRFQVVGKGTEFLKDCNNRLSCLKSVLDGEKKAQIVLEMANSLSVQKEDIFVYTDSFLDLPFLQAAGCPIVVNPDHKLLKLSHQNNWPILT